MTVEELIFELQCYPSDATVYIVDGFVIRDELTYTDLRTVDNDGTEVVVVE